MKGSLKKGRSKDGTKDVYILNICVGDKWQNIYLSRAKEKQVDKYGNETIFFFDTEYNKEKYNTKAGNGKATASNNTASGGNSKGKNNSGGNGEFVDTMDDDIPF
jgi:hypothetical protein